MHIVTYAANPNLSRPESAFRTQTSWNAGAAVSYSLATVGAREPPFGAVIFHYHPGCFFPELW